MSQSLNSIPSTSIDTAHPGKNVYSSALILPLVAKDIDSKVSPKEVLK